MTRGEAQALYEKRWPAQLHNIVQGRCRPCGTAYLWHRGSGRLRGACCPRCGSSLSATTYLYRGNWIMAVPDRFGLRTTAKVLRG